MQTDSRRVKSLRKIIDDIGITPQQAFEFGVSAYLDLCPAKYQLKMIRRMESNLKFISNPTKTMEFAAVRKNPVIIQHIKKPSLKLQLAAVRASPEVISRIKNPGKRVQLIAVSEDGFLIRHIEHPSEEVQLAAIRQVNLAVKYIKKPTKRVQLEALKLGTTSGFLSLQSPSLRLIGDFLRDRIVSQVHEHEDET